MDRHWYIQNLWRWICNLPEEQPSSVVSYEDLARTEWSEEFENLMRNRLIVGAMRYGRLGAKGKPHYDRVRGIQKRLIKYQETGNLEMLIDVANLALLEYVESRHPLKHFEALDEHGSVGHVEVK